jgi:hypothetical protein
MPCQVSQRNDAPNHALERDAARGVARLGFEERTRGGHHLFRKDIEGKINLQRDDSKAKPYQVRQVRRVILKYHLAGKD